MFNIGDYVTRNSYNNDIVFKIIDIKGEVYYLKGVSVRLYADSYQDDLVKCDDEMDKDTFRPSIDEYRNLNRNEYFYLPGRILHIDGDKEYLEKCKDIEILGIANNDKDEKEMIEKLKPEIVITDLMRNGKYSGLDIIKEYTEKGSLPKFLVISASKKEDINLKETNVEGYIKKPFINYSVIIKELKQIKQLI